MSDPKQLIISKIDTFLAKFKEVNQGIQNAKTSQEGFEAMQEHVMFIASGWAEVMQENVKLSKTGNSDDQMLSLQLTTQGIALATKPNDLMDTLAPDFDPTKGDIEKAKKESEEIVKKIEEILALMKNA